MSSPSRNILRWRSDSANERGQAPFEAGVDQHPIDVRRARQHVPDGGIVGRDERAACAGLDGHVAQREPRLDRQRLDRAAAELDGEAARTLGADAADDHQDSLR